MLHFLRAALAVLLLLSVFVGTTTAAQAGTVLVVGDSISAGYGMPTSKVWVKLLEARLVQKGYSHPVVNASVSGDTSAGGLSRLPSLLRQHRPAIVVLELGGND
ncbi:MAG: GDSL-type esterase/lipase family protein, partial [Pseudomonadota bacterium]